MPRRKAITDDVILEHALPVIARVRVWQRARRRAGGGVARRQWHGVDARGGRRDGTRTMVLLRTAIMDRLPPLRLPAATGALRLPPVPAAG